MKSLFRKLRKFGLMMLGLVLMIVEDVRRLRR